MADGIRVKDVIVTARPGVAGERVSLRTLDGDTLSAIVVDRDEALILANYRDSEMKWHPVEIEHPTDPLQAKLRFRDYPGEVVWSYGAEEGRPRAYRSGLLPGDRSGSGSPFHVRFGPDRGQVWEPCEADGHLPPAPVVSRTDLEASARAYPPGGVGASGEGLPEPMDAGRLLLMADRALAESRALGAPGGPSFDGRLRLLAGYFKWSTDDVSRWVGRLLEEKAKHVRFTGAKTPEEYEDRLHAILEEAEAEARSRMRAAPPEEPEGHW